MGMLGQVAFCRGWFESAPCVYVSCCLGRLLVCALERDVMGIERTLPGHGCGCAVGWRMGVVVGSVRLNEAGGIAKGQEV